jgi:hypothetical protein
MRTIAIALVVYWLATRAQPTPGTTLAWTLVPLRTPPPPLPELAPPEVARPSCPPMRTDAAPLPADTPLPHGVNHVTTSWTNAGWLAAWDEEHVQVSTDGGLSFTQMLDGPGQVRDVTFDCFGRAVVLRDGARIGINDHGHERWRTVPGMRTDEDSPAVLLGGGPDVIAIGTTTSETSRARVAVSADLGRTWWYRDLADDWFRSEATGHQSADGTIDVAITTTTPSRYSTTWLRIAPDGKVERDELGNVMGIRLYDKFAISHYDGTSWKRFGEEDWTDATEAEQQQIVHGPVPRLINDYRVEVIHTTSKDEVDPRKSNTFLREWDYDNATVDRAGRLWAIDESIDGEDAWLVAVPNTRGPIRRPLERRPK